MKKKNRSKPISKVRPSRSTKRQGYGDLISSIFSLNAKMVQRVATVANQSLVLRNWMIGAYIVQFEQQGSDRAKYGARLLERLAADLKSRGAKGLSLTSLERSRQFFLIYPSLASQIPSTVLTELSSSHPIPYTPSTEFTKLISIPSTVLRESSLSPHWAPVAQIPEAISADEILQFSWGQLIELIRIDDPWKRAFYERECLANHWSVRQLQRQIESLLYERTGLSKNKKSLLARAQRQEPKEKITDLLRDPYILEFTGLADRPEYSEEELESALLDHLQRFLLELGQGFCFEARQFRMTEGRKHHRVDLVFYHRILRCHILIDLKVRAFRPADAGQMNFYLNWFKANMTEKGSNPPIGILLCSDKDGVEVEFATAGMDQKLFVSRYLTALPTVEQLKAFLERDRAEFKNLKLG